MNLGLPPRVRRGLGQLGLGVALVVLAAGCSAGSGPPSSVDRAPAAREARTTPAASDASPAHAPPPAPPPGPEHVAPSAPPLPKGTVVLHVGDSFVHSGLSQRLRERLAPLEVKYEVRAQHSTNSLDWAKRVPELVTSTQPDLVIITLGGNEIGSKHLDVQARAAKRIVAAIGARPCVWTTPPLWMAESGLFDTLAEAIAPCRFFETDQIVGRYLPRRDDRIHPTAEGGAMWADALFDYLMAERSGERWRLAEAPASERKRRGLRGPLPFDDDGSR